MKYEPRPFLNAILPFPLRQHSIVKDWTWTTDTALATLDQQLKSVRMKSLSRLTLSLVLLIPQILPVRPSLATTIAVLKTPSQIVAGADSMGLFVTGKTRISYRFCKIHGVNDFFIASAGLYDTRAGQRLNITEIVRSVTKKGDPLAVAVNRSSSAIASALSQFLAESTKDEALYSLLVRGNVVTFFFGLEDAKPAVYMNRTVIAPREDSSPPSIESTQENCGPLCIPPDRHPYLMHTPSQAMDDFRSKNPDLLQDDPVAFVRSIVFADIAANKNRSGPPVDVLRLDQSGAMWIDKKPNCP